MNKCYISMTGKKYRVREDWLPPEHSVLIPVRDRLCSCASGCSETLDSDAHMPDCTCSCHVKGIPVVELRRLVYTIVIDCSIDQFGPFILGWAYDLKTLDRMRELWMKRFPVEADQSTLKLHRTKLLVPCDRSYYCENPTVRKMMEEE